MFELLIYALHFWQPPQFLLTKPKPVSLTDEELIPADFKP